MHVMQSNNMMFHCTISVLLLARLHSVGGPVLFCLRASVVFNTTQRNVTHQGTAHRGPVVLHPVRVTPRLE